MFSRDFARSPYIQHCNNFIGTFPCLIIGTVKLVDITKQSLGLSLHRFKRMKRLLGRIHLKKFIKVPNVQGNQSWTFGVWSGRTVVEFIIVCKQRMKKKPIIYSFIQSLLIFFV